MLFHLKRHGDGAFVLASPKEATTSLNITDPQYDADGWWNKNLAVLTLARFNDGDVQMLHYHPGRLGSIRHCIFEFGDLLARVGLIVIVGRAIKKSSGIARNTSDSAVLAKGAIYTFRDGSHMSDHFMDAKKYPEEGYYIGNELLIKGKLTRQHFA